MAANNLLEFILRFRNEGDAAIKQASSSLDKVKASTEKVGQASANSATQVNTLSGGFTGLGSAIAGTLAAIGLTAGINDTIQVIAQFEQAMSSVLAVSGATADEFERMTNEAKKLGSTTRFTATNAADGMLLLSQAGFTAEESLQAIGPALQLAQAGSLDLGRAAEIASSTLRQFSLPVKDITHVMDVLGAAANSTNSSVNSLAEGLKFAGPTGAQLGLSLEQVVAILGKLSNTGLGGGLAGRGFAGLATQFLAQRQAIQQIIGPYNLAAEGLDHLMVRLHEAGITTQQAIEIFGASNIDVYGSLMNASLDANNSISKLTQSLKDSDGTIAKTAAIMDDNLNGAIKGAQSAFEGVQLALGKFGLSDFARGALKDANVGLSALSGFINGLSAASTDAYGKVTLLGDALKAAGNIAGAVVGYIAFASAVNGVVVASTKLAPVFAFVFSAVTSPLGATVIGITAVVSVLVVLYNHVKAVHDVLEPLVKVFHDLFAPSKEQQGLDTAFKNAASATATYQKAIEALTGARGHDLEVAQYQAAQAEKDLRTQQEAAVGTLATLQTRIVNLKAELNRLIEQTSSAPTSAQGADLRASQISSTASQIKNAEAELARLTPIVEQFQNQLRAGAIAKVSADIQGYIDGLREASEKADAERLARESAIREAIGKTHVALEQKLRDAEAQVGFAGLENEALDVAKLKYEVLAKLEDAGVANAEIRNAALQAQLKVIDAIAAANKRAAAATLDQKNVNTLEGPLKEYKLLEASLDRLAAKGVYTGAQLQEALDTSKYQVGFRKFMDTLSGSSGVDIAVRDAQLVQTALLAQLDQYLKDGTVHIEDEAAVRLAIAQKAGVDEANARAAGAKVVQDLDQSIGYGAANDPRLQGKLEQDLAQIDASEEAKRIANQTAYNKHEIDFQQFQDRLTSIQEQGAFLRRDAELKSAQLNLQSTSASLDTVLGVLKDSVGEQSAIYKAMFVANKAFAIANSIVSIQKAIADGFASGTTIYEKFAAVAAIAASTANIISSIKSVTLALASGGYVRGPGGPRDDQISARLSNGEFVVNAESTKRNRALLEAINSQRYAQGGYVTPGGRATPVAVYPGTPGGRELTINNVFNLTSTGTEENNRKLVEQIDRQSRASARIAIREELRAGGMLENARVK
jgi:TP901 family phage tail tape measure protein